MSLLGLAFGFVALILGGYWLWWETHFDNFHPEADRLYCLTTSGLVKRANGTDSELDQLHLNDRAEIRKLLPEIEAECSFLKAYCQVQSTTGLLPVYGLISDTSFFSLFHADFIEGGYKNCKPNGESIILTESTAKRLFGTTDCVGKECVLNDQDHPLVAGVIRNYPDNSDLIFQFLWIDKPMPNRFVQRLTTYVRLHPHANVTQVKEKLAIYRSHADNPKGTDRIENWRIYLRTPSEVHLYCHPELVDRIRNIQILALAGLMAFFSALMNLIVLFIGQQQRKQLKNKTYMSVGASSRSLMMKSWIELLMPMGIAYLIGLCLIELVYPFYENFTNWNLYGIYEGVSRHMERSSLLKKALVISSTSTVLFVLAGYWPVRCLQRNSIQPTIYWKKGLIAAQVFIGSLFLITSIILFRQLHYILSADRGIDYENVIQIDLGYETAIQNDLRFLKPVLLQLPYVEAVTYTAGNAAVFTEQGDWYGSFSSYFIIDPDEAQQVREDIVMAVDKDFFSLFGLTLKSGNWITEANSYGLLINEAGFRELGYEDLLKRSISQPAAKAGVSYNICGILNDYVYAPLQYPTQKIFYCLHTEEMQREMNPAYRFYVRHQPGHKQDVLRHIKKVTALVHSEEQPVERMFISLTDQMAAFNKPEKVIFAIFSLLAGLCILISTFGIYSLVSLATEQRKKEIAIRKINGATFLPILHLFQKEYLKLVVVGNAFALPCGFLLMQQWLETYAHHVTLTVWPFLLVFLITSLVVILSIALQVYRIASTNPSEALKMNN